MVLVKFTLIGVSLIFGLTQYFNQSGTPEAPKLPDTWWGSESKNKVGDAIKSFKINFSQEAIDDLKYRLKNTRSSKPSLDGAAWTNGVNNAFVPVIVDYWLNKYNFTAREKYLNKYPQFITNIQGLDIHFLHVKPQNTTGKQVFPLIIQHGWPSSIADFYKIIPLLTTPRDGYDFVFEVIAPSLPGFGFSSATTKPGLGPAQMAVIMKNLMLKLGFNKFYAQGGDWGGIVTTYMASLFPEHVLGVHSNTCRVDLLETSLTATIFRYWPAKYLPTTQKQLVSPLSKNWSIAIEEFGYLHIQATKPDTLGIGLSDSPAGLAAWILEKFSTGSNPAWRLKENGGLLEAYDLDELVDAVMLYWIPNSMSTAIRIYAENYSDAHIALGMEYVPINVPSACALFPYDLFSGQNATVLSSGRFKNLVHFTTMPRGGHFAAFEEPHLLADDFWTSIGIMESIRNKAELQA